MELRDDHAVSVQRPIIQFDADREPVFSPLEGAVVGFGVSGFRRYGGLIMYFPVVAPVARRLQEGCLAVSGIVHATLSNDAYSFSYATISFFE